MEMEKQIKDLAQNLIGTLSEMLGVNLKYDRASVEWLDGYIERIRPTLDETSVNGLANSIGSFLGECIIANHGGVWREAEGTWGVYFDEKNAAYPFAKAQKHLLNGRADSILSFYDVIPVVFGTSPEI
jgi:hypothetical protein